ncbi:ABC transporter permease [Microbacterium foliorum]
MGAIAVPATTGLSEVGKRPRFGAYLADTWQMHAFALRLAGSRLIAGLLPNRLGMLWVVLKPLSLAIVYGTIFNFILAGAARPANFVPYLIVGVFVFEFFTGCFGSGSKSITSNAKLVQSFGFPRILLPISVIVEQALRMIPVVLLLGILLLILGEPISWSWLLLVPILAVMGVFNLGVALVVARISVRTRDIQQLVPIINRVLFYASGIFFNIDGALAGYPTLLTIAHLLPTYEFIALARDVMLDGYAAPALAWIAAPIWAFVAIVAGTVFFWQGEPRYGLSD